MIHSTESEIIVEGNDLEDALAAASEQLGVDRNILEYRVIDSNISGIFGLFKKRKITIKAWWRDDVPCPSGCRAISPGDSQPYEDQRPRNGQGDRRGAHAYY